jgi:hypothetical protein
VPAGNVFLDDQYAGKMGYILREVTEPHIRMWWKKRQNEINVLP